MKIIKTESSFYFLNAEVLTTDCEHKHVRPIGMYKIGAEMNCPFCNDVTESMKNS